MSATDITRSSLFRVSLAAGALAAAALFAAAAASQSDAAGAQPELKSAKIEFAPGERTVLFDDFSDMLPDEPPPHWKVREGTVALRTGGGVHELYAENSVNLTSGKFVMPADFTVEIDWTGGGEMTWHFRDNDDQDVLTAMVRGEESGEDASTTVTAGNEDLGHGEVKANTNQPVHFALWAQQGRVRAYINGQRLVDANQVKFGPITHIYATLAGYRPNGVRSVRVAESAPDFSSVINSAGKYVTHGIYFDTDSDRLGFLRIRAHLACRWPPRSRAILISNSKSTATPTPPATPRITLDLSKRRAQAVQAVLVSQFAIDAARLSSNGFGAASPIASNDAPDGRANNRRVEFIKK